MINSTDILATDILGAGDDVVAREVGGEQVLLHLGSGIYFGLNAVGGRLWQLLEAGGCSLGQLVDAIEAEFDAPRATIEADLQAVVADLLANELVTRTPA